MIVLHFLEHESGTKRDKSILSHKRRTSRLILTLFISQRNIRNIFRLNGEVSVASKEPVLSAAMLHAGARAIAHYDCLRVM